MQLGERDRFGELAGAIGEEREDRFSLEVRARGLLDLAEGGLRSADDVPEPGALRRRALADEAEGFLRLLYCFLRAPEITEGLCRPRERARQALRVAAAGTAGLAVGAESGLLDAAEFAASRLTDTVISRLADLMRGHDIAIDRAVVCPVKPRTYHLESANEVVAEAVRARPLRLVGFARLDPNLGEEACSALGAPSGWSTTMSRARRESSTARSASRSGDQPSSSSARRSRRAATRRSSASRPASLSTIASLGPST